MTKLSVFKYWFKGNKLQKQHCPRTGLSQVFAVQTASVL